MQNNFNKWPFEISEKNMPKPEIKYIYNHSVLITLISLMFEF